MSSTYFYAIALSFVVGLGCAFMIPVGPVYLWWGVIVAVALCVLALRAVRAAHTPVLLFGICTVSFLFGALHATDAQQSFTQLAQLTVPEQTVISGVVVREPEVRERTTHVYIDTGVTVVLAYVDRHTAVSYGDTLVLSGELLRPRAFTTEFGRSFNYPGYLQARGVTHVLYYPQLIERTPAVKTTVLGILFSLKDSFRAVLQQQLPAPQSALGEGILLGVNGVLGEAWETIFRKTGIIHIVVLSGYNIMLVIVFTQYVLAFLLPYRARLFFGLGAVIGFACLVGLSATVLRASVMATILLALQFSGNTYNVLRALILAGILMLLWNPFLLLYDPGFQLSFLATLGLIFLASPLTAQLRRLPNMLSMRNFLVATLATQLFVLPFLLYQIGEISVVSVVVNVLVLPVVPVAMLATFFLGAIGALLPVAAPVLAMVAYVPLTYILRVAELFSHTPFAAVAVPAFPVWVMIALYAMLAGWIYYLLKPKQRRLYKHWTIEDETVLGNKIMAAPKGTTIIETPVFFR